MQPGFFDLDMRHRKLNERDPLVTLNQLIDWDDFRPTLLKIREKPRKSNAGRRPTDVLIMFKALILQHLYNTATTSLNIKFETATAFADS